MAHIYVGFHDQRNSSRVLKPPGGGTSNIFGGELVPDVVPHISHRKDPNQRGSSIQDVLQSETVTTSITRREETSSSTSTNGTVVAQENKVSKVESSEHQSNGNAVHQEVAVVQQEHPGQKAITSTPDIAAEVTCKVEHLKIEERSSKAHVTETDSSGNTKVLLNESNSEGSVEHNSSVKKGSSVGAILNEDDILEKRRVKGGQPQQRVPPGGYSSGLW